MTNSMAQSLGHWARIAAVWLAWRLALLGVAAGIFALIVAVIAYFVITPRSFDLAEIERTNRIPGMTYLDVHGNLLATRGAYHGDPVDVETLPPYVVQAFLSTEDRRFYRHYGIDPRGLLRATISNLRAGRLVEGGSTITQQLAKNLFLNGDRTMSRKLNEMFFAIWLERHLTKDQILTIYLNRIYMGAGTYGLSAASDFYFGKSPSEVTLAEAAMLAGLPKAPSSLAPTSNLANAQNRAAHVLDNMVEARFLTADDVAEAKENPAQVADRVKLGAIQYFLDYVHATLPSLVEEMSEDLIITTTLDTDLQLAAETALRNKIHQRDACKGAVALEQGSSQVSEGERASVGQGALVAYAADGSLRAMVGGRCYTDSQFNRAAQAKRQPGSAFKPFVYLAALQHGFKPDTIVEDEPIRIGDWQPTNYTNTYSGRVTLRQALSKSINTVSAKLTEKVTPAKVVETAQAMGIKSPLLPVHSIALGTSQVTPDEMTAAFIPFANSGISHPAHAILEITNASGEVMYQYEAPLPDRLFPKSVARDMNDLMFHVVREGTGRNADFRESGIVAGKTGTSQEWRDAWFVGYSSELVAGVWVGNDDDSPMNHVTGGGLPARIWKDFMVDARQIMETAPKSAGSKTVREVKRWKKLPGAIQHNDKQTAELRAYYRETFGGSEPRQQFKAEWQCR